MKKLCPTILEILASLSLCIAVTIAAVYITLRFTPLYKFDINYLNIENSAKLNRIQLTNNYLAIIGYLENPSIQVLSLPNLKLSNNAQTHFFQVRNIFITLKYVLYGCIFTGVLSIAFLHKRKRYNFYKYTTILLTVFPIALAIPFLINFDKSFTIFHKLVFKDGDWEFDPAIDPFINTLPQEFFFHCSMLILLIMLLFSLYFGIMFIKKSKKAL